MPIAAQAGSHIQTLFFVVAVLLHLAGKCRAGTNDAHITLQDIPQLRQLIEANRTDDPSDRRDPIVVLAGQAGAALLRIHDHAAQF